MEPRQEVDLDTDKTQNRVPKLKEQKNPVLQHSKPGPKAQRREKPSSLNTEGEGVEQKYS